ncbi:MAG: hypothetical protein JWM07_178 [Candidatus Saccharibacteria bacterium]|nr:hypothetical protein [Candidatus Saccharibacteria bacterium]
MNEQGVYEMPYDTLEREQTHEVVCLAENGLGFGEGKISVAKRIENSELSHDDLRIGNEIISNDPEVFSKTDIDANDDGCGDGRQAARIFRIVDTKTGEMEEFNKSRRRAKLFGGGLVVASSMWRAISGPVRRNETVLGDRQFIAGKLSDMNIEYGAHTDTDAEGDMSGCGAIDHHPKTTKNALKYRTQIEGVLRVLYGESYAENVTAIESVFATYQAIEDDKMYYSNADGKSTMDFIKNDGAVIKELSADHLEAYVVLNDIEGTTFDQRKFDVKLKDAGVESEPQAFVIDIWRGRMYADAIAQIAVENIPGIDFEEARKIAYADFLIRTLGVSSTLTAGDQPVLARMRENHADFALTA